MTHTNSQSPESTFRVNVRVKKHKTQGQMLADFSEAVIAKREAESLALPPYPQGFIPHDGGPCPVADGTKGAILCRGNEKPYLYTPSSLDSVQWMHCSKPNDIIAYRIERSPDFNVEAGKFYITASGERVGPMRETNLWGRLLDTPKCIRLWCPDGAHYLRFKSQHNLLALAADQTSPMVSE